MAKMIARLVDYKELWLLLNFELVLSILLICELSKLESDNFPESTLNYKKIKNDVYHNVVVIKQCESF